VKLVTGEAVGRVDEVRRYGWQITLVIRHGGQEILIPAVAPILNPDTGLEGPLLIDPPEGLLDVGD
jgi:ribosomal 30S subunit maturation factor RimM